MKTEINPQQCDHEQLANQWVDGYSVTGWEDFGRVAPYLWRELATTGQPVQPERLVALSGVPRDQVVAVMREVRAEWDPSGEHLAGQGVTLLQTPHRYERDGRTVWTWCAADLLILPVVLGEPARIQSPCAATGDPVRVEATATSVEDVEPASAVAAIVMTAPDNLGAIRQEVCHQQNFYRDAEAGAGWLAANPHGQLLPMADAFEVFRRVYRRILPAEFLN